MSIKEETMNIIDSDNRSQAINKIISDGKNYGKSNYGSGKRINIEYTPLSKEMNNDTIKLVIYGDCLSNIMSFIGYDVTREFYVRNDDIDAEELKKEFDKIRVNFDIFTKEQSLYDNGLVDVVLSKLQRSGKCYIDNDTLWLKTTDLYDNQNRVLINGNGTYSYLLPEIAYHVDKFNRKFDYIVDIFNKEHRCIDGIKSGVEIAGYSSRKLYIKIIEKDDNIIDSKDVNSLRYCLACTYGNQENNMNNSIDYIENAYTKICLLVRGKSYETKDEYSIMELEKAYTIVDKLIEFEKIVIEASSGEINILCKYLYELANLYYDYEKEEGIDYNNKYENEKYVLLTAIKIVMNNAANILGLILREKM